MIDPELARKNMLWGWALLGLMLALFAGVVVVALVYLALD
jgi:nitrogen fixation protein FixH